MAGSFSNAKALSTLVSNTIARRGYAAAAASPGLEAAAAASATRSVVNLGGNKKEEEKVGSVFKVSWVPNPKTGVYGPESHADQIDAAELRNALLKKH